MRGRWALNVALKVLGAVFLVFPLAALAQTRGAHPVPPELLQKAWDEGSVRVIVELGGARVEPESRLSGHERSCSSA